MKTSEQTDQIAGALSTAQGKFKNPEKNRTAKIPTKAGGSYSFDYADLPSIYDTNRQVLAENGLSHTFGTWVESGVTMASCRLSHKSGQWYESSLVLPRADDVKSLAGNLTYFRRYLINGLLGVAGDDDVDGEPENGASYSQRGKSSKAPSPPATSNGKVASEQGSNPPKNSQNTSSSAAQTQVSPTIQKFRKTVWDKCQELQWSADTLVQHCKRHFAKTHMELGEQELAKLIGQLDTALETKE